MRIVNGRVGIGTNNPQQALHVVGNTLATGTITPNSDRNAKTDFAAVDNDSILERVSKLNIQQWRFKAETEGVKHIGPMAQDFREAFGLGENPTAIATVDADGVALAAIQGLNQKLEQAVRERDERIKSLIDGFQSAGYHSVTWDSKNFSSGQIGSGVYFYRLVATDVASPGHTFDRVRKMILLK